MRYSEKETRVYSDVPNELQAHLPSGPERMAGSMSQVEDLLGRLRHVENLLGVEPRDPNVVIDKCPSPPVPSTIVGIMQDGPAYLSDKVSGCHQSLDRICEALGLFE